MAESVLQQEENQEQKIVELLKGTEMIYSGIQEREEGTLVLLTEKISGTTRAIKISEITEEKIRRLAEEIVHQELENSDFLNADWKPNTQEKINRIVDKEIFKFFQKIICRKTTMDVLKCVAFKNHYITGTNLGCSLVYENGNEFTLECAIPVEVLRERKLSELSLTLQGVGKVSLGDLTVKAYPIHEFPSVNPEHEAKCWEMDTPTFLNAVDKCIPFSSSDESRYVINGVLWKNIGEKNLMSFCSTDGRRMQLLNLPSEIEEDFEIIVPAENLRKCTDILSKIKTARISFAIKSEKTEGSEEERRRLIVRFDKFTFLSRLIEGSFPDYNNVIPKELHSFFLLDKKQVLCFIKKVELMEKVNKANCEGLNFALKNGKITVWTIIAESIAQRIDTEELHADPVINAYKNLHLIMPMRVERQFPNLLFMLAPVYLKESLSVIDSEKFILGFNKDNKNSPLVILDPEWNKKEVRWVES